MPKAKTWEQHKEECEKIAKKGISIVRWYGNWEGNKTKIVTSCDIHGEWDTCTINNFKRGVSCPRCSQRGAVKWEVYESEIVSKLPPHITLVGYVGDWKGNRTKLKCNCNIHGDWDSSTIMSIMRGIGCPSCKADKIGNNNRKPDEHFISQFTRANSYPEGTLFSRSDKLNCMGHPRYWNVFCPICAKDKYAQAGVDDGVFVSGTSELQRGIVPCRCSKGPRVLSKKEWDFKIAEKCKNKNYTFVGWKTDVYGIDARIKFICPEHGEKSIVAAKLLIGQGCAQCKGKNQQQGYINRVFDTNGQPYALKFGIANDSEHRVKIQNSKNEFTMEQERIYFFPTVETCKNAEKHCKKVLECGVVSKRKMKDGWTETTYLLNFTKIVEIYESFGGELQK